MVIPNAQFLRHPVAASQADLDRPHIGIVEDWKATVSREGLYVST